MLSANQDQASLKTEDIMYLKKGNTKLSENPQHEYKHYQHITIHSRLLTRGIDRCTLENNDMIPLLILSGTD